MSTKASGRRCDVGAVRLALTGATGFVGRHVVDHALADGHEVRALTRRVRAPRDGVTWIDGALDERPKGKLRHRALGNLPVVGVLGGYAAEREGLRRAAARADALLIGATAPGGAA